MTGSDFSVLSAQRETTLCAARSDDISAQFVVKRRKLCITKCFSEANLIVNSPKSVNADSGRDSWIRPKSKTCKLVSYGVIT